MSDSVVAALISAFASITVAVIGKAVAASARTGSSQRLRSQAQVRPWLPALVLLGLWLLISPAALHHDIAGQNYLVIPVVMVVLVLWRPRAPWTGAWVTLAAFSANFVLGPFSNRMAGASNDTAFVPELEKLPLLAGIVVGSTLLVALLGWLRLRYSQPSSLPSSESTIVEGSPLGSPDMVGDLERLTRLHSAGELSDGEFAAAKRRVLGIL